MLVVLLHLCVGRPGLLPSNAASSSCITTLRNAAARRYGRCFIATSRHSAEGLVVGSQRCSRGRHTRAITFIHSASDSTARALKTNRSISNIYLNLLPHHLAGAPLSPWPLRPPRQSRASPSASRRRPSAVAPVAPPQNRQPEIVDCSGEAVGGGRARAERRAPRPAPSCSRVATSSSCATRAARRANRSPERRTVSCSRLFAAGRRRHSRVRDR